MFLMHDRMTTGFTLRIMWLAAIATLAGGCAAPGMRDAMNGLAAFTTLPGNSHVRYASGAEANARRVAAILQRAIAAVEAGHYLPFRAPPTIFLCDTDECFHRFVPARFNFTAAVVYDNRLVLAPRLFDREAERLEPILVHELSHLHLGQRRGHYTMAIPVWFHEGLASLVAAGGGADLSTDQQAAYEARSGKYFLPDEQHLPWLRRMPQQFDVSIHVFYRQAYVFLKRLRADNPQAFRALVLKLQDGEDFDAAFAQSFHANPARLASGFFRGLHCAGAPAGLSECVDETNERLTSDMD
jgi:hypothetical protein